MSRQSDLVELTRKKAQALSSGSKNLVINGDMQVHQRGGSTTTSGYHIDRWTCSFSGVAVTRTHDSDVPSGLGFSSSLKHENTSASTATNAYVATQQHIEAVNIRNCGWDYTNPNSYITISFWAKSSIDGTYFMTLRTYDGTQHEYAAPYTLVANTWKRVSFKIPGDSGLTFNNDTGQGLTIFPFLEMGSDYTDNAGIAESTWTAYVGTAQTRDKESNWMATSGAAFWLTGVQCEVGSEMTDFQHIPFSEQMTRCQRYYFVSNGNQLSIANATTTGYSYRNPRAMQTAFPVTMRVQPTFTRITSQSTLSGGVYIAGDTNFCQIVPNSYATDIPSGAYDYGGFTADAEL